MDDHPPVDEQSKARQLAAFSEDPADQFLTTDQGVRVSDTDNSLKAGARGPTLLEDFHLREKITHFDHERIPERVVHARGSAAHGVLPGLRVAGRRHQRAASCRTRRCRRRSSCASRPWPGRAARPTPRATCAASRRSSTPRRATSTWSATTSRSSSSRTRSSSPTCPRGQARAAQRDPAGRVGARHVLGLRLADARDRRTC